MIKIVTKIVTNMTKLVTINDKDMTNIVTLGDKFQTKTISQIKQRCKDMMTVKNKILTD